MHGTDPVQLQLVESKSQDGTSRLCGITGVPVRFSDPVTEFAFVEAAINPESYCANNRFAILKRHCECHRFPYFVLRLVPLDPLFGHAVLVGVWDIHRRISNVAASGKAFNNRGIAEAKWPQNQTCCLKPWLGHGISNWIADFMLSVPGVCSLVASASPSGRRESFYLGLFDRRPCDACRRFPAIADSRPMLESAAL